MPTTSTRTRRSRARARRRARRRRDSARRRRSRATRSWRVPARAGARARHRFAIFGGDDDGGRPINPQIAVGAPRRSGARLLAPHVVRGRCAAADPPTRIINAALDRRRGAVPSPAPPRRAGRRRSTGSRRAPNPRGRRRRPDLRGAAVPRAADKAAPPRRALPRRALRLRPLYSRGPDALGARRPGPSDRLAPRATAFTRRTPWATTWPLPRASRSSGARRDATTGRVRGARGALATRPRGGY